MNVYAIGVSLVAAGLSAIIAPSSQRGAAAVVGGLVTFAGNATGVTGRIGMALCPFGGEGAIGCALPTMLFPGVLTGIGFRVAPRLRGEVA
jgi:hypothetical protein